MSDNRIPRSRLIQRLWMPIHEDRFEPEQSADETGSRLYRFEDAEFPALSAADSLVPEPTVSGHRPRYS